MDNATAKHVTDCDAGKRDDSGHVLCPYCNEAVRERDIEEYSEEGSDRTIEICTKCREDFERDLGQEFDSDTLSKQAFSRIWDALPTQEEASGLNEVTAEQVAQALGGEAWQSGGGIWLVVIRRNDGKLAVISDDVVCEYASEGDFEAGRAEKSVLLA